MTGDRDNNLVATGAIHALLVLEQGAVAALTSVEAIVDEHGVATNQIDVGLSFMKSAYRLTVERVPDDQAAADDPPGDLAAERAELTDLIGTISRHSVDDSPLLGLLLTYVPMHDWAALEADLRRDFHAPGRAIVPTDRTG